MNRLIVNLAPTGMIPTREMTPHVPLSPDEIASDVLRCAERGASMVHLHARDAQGKPTHDQETFRCIIEKIRAQRRDLILVVSTSGRRVIEFEKRADVLGINGDLRPDMASLTLGSLNFNREASLNSPDSILRLLDRMQERGVKPELEVFDLGMVNYAAYLASRGHLVPPFYFNIFLGNVAGAQANMLHLGLLASELPAPCFWSVATMGRCKNSVAAAGIIFGNGVRVGIEDNIWYDDSRTVLATNDSFVERAVTLASLVGRPVAAPCEVRRMLGLPGSG